MRNNECLSEAELYCTAKIIQSVLFGEDANIFYGCKYCEYMSECMPNKMPHKDMIFDRVRKKLQRLTAVDLDMFSKNSKFTDSYQR